MKRLKRNIIIGFLVLTTFMMTCMPSMAAGVDTSIYVTFNSINFMVEGFPVQIDNILYRDTTYVPLRAVSEMFNRDVGWDGNTNTVSINNKANGDTGLKILPANKGIISYDFGHMEGGGDTSASGILYEYRVVRDYGSACIRYLEEAGYTCINCTPPDGDMDLDRSLYYRVDKANQTGSQLHLCFHANCYDGVANGAEIEVLNYESEIVARPVLNKICSLGYYNRGINRPDLYVTKYSIMPCLLIEPFFIDNADDVLLYNADQLGKAIAEGILGHEIFIPGSSEMIGVTVNAVNMTVNGQKVYASNILYNDVTYVPLRVVAEMLNKGVAWNADTNTASIDDID